MRVRVRGYITGARVLHRGPKLIPLAPTGSSAAWLGIARDHSGVSEVREEYLRG